MIPLVDILVVTYNQEKFIGQALDSILMQQCNFPYRIIIGEDHSTDYTANICESYQQKFADKILLIRNTENLGLVRNYKSVFDAAEAKYICILEGDDYWIDPLKLQKQVDLLESDARIGVVHTRSYTLYEDGTKNTTHLTTPRKMLEGNLYEVLMTWKNVISPLTVCFRRDLLKNVDYNFFIANELKTIDYALWLELSRHGRIAFMDDVTAVYRFLNTSISHGSSFEKLNKFYQTSLTVKRYYQQKYPIAGMTEQRLLHRYYYILGDQLVREGRFKEAKSYNEKLLRKHPPSLLLWAAINFKILRPFYTLNSLSVQMLSKMKQIIFKSLRK